MNIHAKYFNIIAIASLIIFLIMFALPTIIIDPYFHYHKPLEDFAYIIENERYQNNGIVRHFEYDAIVTGTSMTENFKTSEMDELFGTNAIKVAYAGGSYKEINDNLLVALQSNPDIKLVIRGADINRLILEKDAPFHGIADQGYVYPYYLIDSNPFNDVSYVFNKEILLNKSLKVLAYTRNGGITTSFDEYAFWGNKYVFGKEAVLKEYERSEEIVNLSKKLSDEECKMVLENVNQNITETANAYPNTDFYVFISPYSICWWDGIVRDGSFGYFMEALQLEIEELLKVNNIKIFVFWTNTEMICNLENYKDQAHYSAKINSQILQWMADDEYLITKDNYQAYLDEIYEFYSTYDYDSIFEE